MRQFILFLTLLLSPILKAEPIRIGTLVYYPPFVVEADKKGHFFGFEVELMMEACNRIQADCHFIPLTFSQIFTELLAGHINLGLAAISITELREETFLFSLPYLVSGGQFITTSDSSINSLHDIGEKKVGLVQGTLFKALVLEHYNNLAQIIEYPTLSEVFQALSTHRIDVAITDEGAAKYWAATNSTLFKLVGHSIPIGIGYGIMATKEEAILINRINKALIDMEEDGSYLKIYDRYFSKMSL